MHVEKRHKETYRRSPTADFENSDTMLDNHLSNNLNYQKTPPTMYIKLLVFSRCLVHRVENLGMFVLARELRIWAVDIVGPFPSHLILLGLSIKKKKDFSLCFFCYARKIIFLFRLIDTESNRFNDSYAGIQKLLK